MDFMKQLLPFMTQMNGPYLLRHNSHLRCNCIDPVTSDAKATCLLCGGTGQRYTLVPVMVTRQLGSTPDSYPYLLFQSELGRTAIPALRFYFPADTIVRTGDELWEVEWHGDLPVNVLSITELSYVDPVVEANFHKVFIRAYGKFIPNELQISRFIVKSQAGLPMYEPQFDGGRI